MLDLSHEHYMREALKEAQKAYELDEVPIGAIIVCDERIIARAHNYTEHLNDVTAHAEMQAFTAASNYLGAKYLKECSLYVTLEPCVMCAGASYWTQIKQIIFAANDPKRGYSLISKNIIHPKTKIIKGILEKEAETLLKQYFSNKR